MTDEIIFYIYSWLIYVLDFPNFVLTDIQECKRIKMRSWFQQYNSVSYTAQIKLCHIQIFYSVPGELSLLHIVAAVLMPRRANKASWPSSHDAIIFSYEVKPHTNHWVLFSPDTGMLISIKSQRQKLPSSTLTQNVPKRH